MDIYAQNILDRYKKPFYKGVIGKTEISGTEISASCGDKITINLKTKDNKVNEYAFDGEGCAISMAAADMTGDLIKDRTLDEIVKLKKEDIYEILGIEISESRSKCALLALFTLQNAILKSQKKELREWNYYFD